MPKVQVEVHETMEFQVHVLQTEAIPVIIIEHNH